MPVFNLGPLGSFQVTRVTKESSTAAANKIAVQRYGAPPSYCIEIEPFYLEALRGPTKAQPSPCKKQQLRRYVLEIIAITFNANFDKLNTAIHGQATPSQTSSILSNQERSDLYKLSLLVRKVHKQLSDRQISTVDEEDEEKLRNAVFRPAADITGYSSSSCIVLDLIAWYGEHAHHRTQWSDTIPGCWETDDTHIGTFGGLTFEPLFIRNMEELKGLISLYSDSDSVEAVLNVAFENCRRRCCLPAIELIPLFWLVRPGYEALAQSLSPDGEGGTSLRMRDLRQLDAEVEAHKARLEVRRRAV
ncbi:hypothetical protein N0V95_004250 [Ascochyta clinopodiicola]|nr:hypothetical protein N0V95_004250 [Ascochyta clinopodiicola]